MPHGGPNLGKIAYVIVAALSHARLLFLQRGIPPAEPARDPWSHRWPWFPTTSLARQVGGSLART